jgi:hypothetical protein
MGLFWMSANGNDGIGLSTPTPPSRAWRPSEEGVAIAAAVARKRCTMDRIKVGEGGFGLILTFLPWNILIAVDRVTQRIISSLGG